MHLPVNVPLGDKRPGKIPLVFPAHFAAAIRKRNGTPCSGLKSTQRLWQLLLQTPPKIAGFSA
jgi:hypothetical protein